MKKYEKICRRRGGGVESKHALGECLFRAITECLRGIYLCSAKIIFAVSYFKKYTYMQLHSVWSSERLGKE